MADLYCSRIGEWETFGEKSNNSLHKRSWKREAQPQHCVLERVRAACLDQDTRFHLLSLPTFCDFKQMFLSGHDESHSAPVVSNEQIQATLQIPAAFPYFFFCVTMFPLSASLCTPPALCTLLMFTVFLFPSLLSKPWDSTVSMHTFYSSVSLCFCVYFSQMSPLSFFNLWTYSPPSMFASYPWTTSSWLWLWVMCYVNNNIYTYSIGIIIWLVFSAPFRVEVFSFFTLPLP